MKKTPEQKRIEYLEQENLFLYIIKSITWNYHYYLDNYIKFIEKNDTENAKDFKIKAKSVQARINFYERKLRRFKNLYDKQEQKYGMNFGRNKDIVMQIIQKFPEFFFSFNKKTELKYKFTKENKDYYSHKPFKCGIYTKDTEELLLEISVSPSYINFKFYCDKNNKYSLDSNVLEYILNLLKINNKEPIPTYGNINHSYAKDTLDLHINEYMVSFFVY